MVRHLLKNLKPILDTNNIKIITSSKTRKNEISSILEKIFSRRENEKMRREEAEKNKTEYGNNP
jgi:hypothetical protein